MLTSRLRRDVLAVRLTTDSIRRRNLDFWLSTGDAHFWNFGRHDAREPTGKRRIDTLMREQAATLDPARRKELFNEVQRIFAENLPVLYFAAPRMYYAHNARVQGVVPSVLRPPALWNADMLSVRASGAP